MAPANSLTSKLCLFCSTSDLQKFLTKSTTAGVTGDHGEEPVLVKAKEENTSGPLEWTSPVTTLDTNTTFLLQDQLKIVFILLKLLDFPEEKLVQYLQLNDGVDNPLMWFSVCTNCVKIVEQGYKVYCQIECLKRTLTVIKDDLKSLILSSQTKKGNRRRPGRNNKVDTVTLDIREYIILKSQPDGGSTGVAGKEEVDGGGSCWKRETTPPEASSSSFVFKNTINVTNHNEPIAPDPKIDNDDGKEDNFFMDDNDQDDWQPSYKEEEKFLEDEVPSPRRNAKRRPKRSRKPVKWKGELKQTAAESLETNVKTEKEREDNTQLSTSTIVLSYHVSKRHRSKLPKRKSRRDIAHQKRIKKVQTYHHKNIKTEAGLPYYCDNCPLIFTTMRRLLEHISLYHQEGHRVQCSFCDCSGFETKQLLQLHCRDEHPSETIEAPIVQDNRDEPEIFLCLHCSDSFPSKLDRDFHLAKLHRDKLLVCELCDCGRKFKKPYEYFAHKKTNHENGKLLCEKCPKSFTTIYYLKCHMRMEHDIKLGDESDIKCVECNATFPSDDQLRKHVKYVHQKIKQLFCEHCGKAFSRNSDLTKHILLHTAPREKQYKQGPFFCEFCQAKFNVRQGLYYHLKKLHSDKYYFKCEHCGTGYATRNTLIQHKRKCKGMSVTPAAAPSSFMSSTTMVTTIDPIDSTLNTEEDL